MTPESSTRKVQIGDATLIQAEAVATMRHELPDSFDLAIADPPYGASTEADWKLERGHRLPGMGGRWKLADHEWDMFRGIDGFEFTVAWLSELKRLVKPTGSIWLHGTYHNIGWLNVACQLLNIEIINEVVWFKRNAFPNLAARRLTASHESLLWCHTGGNKREYRFNYDDVKAATFPEDSLKIPGKQMRTVWDIPNNKAKDELRYGQHPTQKPLRLLERMLVIAGVKGGSCLVPFMGSGSEMIACLRWGMKPTGIEHDAAFFDISAARVKAEVEHKEQAPTLQFEVGDNA